MLPEDFYVKAITSSKMFYLSQQQIEKSILLSFGEDEDDEKSLVDDVILQETVSQLEFPEYRRAFTHSSALSVVRITGGS